MTTQKRIHARKTFLPGLCAAVLIGSLVGLAGCSNERSGLGSVSGTVTNDGQPISGVSVKFRPEEGTPSYGTTDKSGKYRVGYVGTSMGAEIGTHHVILVYTEGADTSQAKIPDVASEQGIKREVQAGDNQFDFDLSNLE